MNAPPVYGFLGALDDLFGLPDPEPIRTGASFIDFIRRFPVPRNRLSSVWAPDRILKITVISDPMKVVVKLDDRTLPSLFVFGLPQFPGAGCLERFSFNDHFITFYCERYPTRTYMFYFGNSFINPLCNTVDFFQSDFQPVREGVAQTMSALYIAGWTPNSHVINRILLIRTFDDVVLDNSRTSPTELSELLAMVNTKSLIVRCHPGMNYVFPRLTVATFEMKYEFRGRIPWFEYHHLDSLDCSEIAIWRSQLTNYDLKKLLVNWSLGRFRKLKMFVSLQKKDNGDILDYCENRIWPYPRGEGFQRPPHVVQDMGLTPVLGDSEGVDIQRYDDAWGTFFVKGMAEESTSRSFYFIVWPDFELDA